MARFVTAIAYGTLLFVSSIWPTDAQTPPRPTIDPMTPPVLAHMTRVSTFRASFGGMGDLFLKVVDTHLVWDETTKSLTGCFASEASREDRTKFVAIAAAWEEKRPNLFDFGSVPDYRTCSGSNTENIRVAFKREEENGRPKNHWSWVGRDAVKNSGTTLNINPDAIREEIGITFRFAVLHELGHALGLEHEHKNRNIRCYDKIIWPEALRTYHWLTLDAIKSMFSVLEDSRYASPRYDNASVMHYYIDPDMLQGGTSSPCYKTISDQLSDDDRKSPLELYPSDPQIAVAAFQSRIAKTNKMLAGIPLTGSQRVLLGQELTSALVLGKEGGANATFKLGPLREEEPAISKKLARENLFKGAGPAPDCTPSSLRAQATCSLGKNGSELQISVY
jgi:Astacin (Peptidase family M12A)